MGGCKKNRVKLMHILRTEHLSPSLVISGDQPQRSWVSDENKTGRDLILEVFFW